MTKGHGKRVEVLIVQLENGFFVLDTVLNETVFVLLEGNRVQKGGNFRIVTSITGACVGLTRAGSTASILLCLNVKGILEVHGSVLSTRCLWRRNAIYERVPTVLRR